VLDGEDGRTPAGAVVGAAGAPGTGELGAALGAEAGAAGVTLGAACTSGRRAGDPVGGIGSFVVPGAGAACGAAARSGVPTVPSIRCGTAAPLGRGAGSGRTAASPGSGSGAGDSRIGGSMP
jgi:hypothetical protein